MKTKIIYTILSLILFTTFSPHVIQAQVTVGSGEAPAKHALLQLRDKERSDSDPHDGITATNGGLLLPRVQLVQRTELQPFVSNLSDPNYAKLKLEHTGLIVYNIQDVPLEKLSRGLNIWNGKEWKALAEALGKASFKFCTEDIEIKGSYIEGKELTSANFLKIKVDVTVPGAYEIIGSTTNGYFFTASGQFLAAGSYVISAQGQGTPKDKGINIVSITNNGDEITCSNNLHINVSSSVANYSIDCTGTIVNGVYTLGGNLNAANTVTMKINVKTAGSWEISSPEVDGISFYGSGTFGASELGTRTVTLLGNGIPAKGGSIDIPLSSNSIGGVNMNCLAKVMISISPKKILGLSEVGFYSLGTTSAGYTLLKNTQNFGSQPDSKFKVQNIQIASREGVLFAANTTIAGFENRTISDLLLGNNPVDIVFIGFNCRPLNGEACEVLAKYVKRGGVLIWADENTEGAEGAGGGGRNFFKKLYDDLSITTKLEDELAIPGGALYKMPLYDDMILNGPFGDLRGRFIGEDAGYTDGFPISGPMGQLAEWYYNGYNHSSNTSTTAATNCIVGFKAKNYPLVWFGDGGIFAGNTTDTSQIIYPAKITPTGEPADKLYGNGSNTRYVVNSTLFCNLMSWALLKAEQEGINSK